MIDTYADEMNEARQRKKQLRPVFLNEQETAQENKKRVKLKDGNGSLRSEIGEIVDKHTVDWKAGHNHLIVDQILALIESKMEELYNPEITDLEVDGYKGEDRPVVYLDSVKSILKGGTE
jgi:hypothetical protein